MRYNLFLDDFRDPEDAFQHMMLPVYLLEDWLIVRNYDEFINVIQEKGIPEMISFDHDLADAHYDNQVNIPYDEYQEKSGYHCAKWLIDYCIDNDKELPASIYIHSMNHAGSLNIKSLFQSYWKSLGLPSTS
jgi:hypothetical protein